MGRIIATRGGIASWSDPQEQSYDAVIRVFIADDHPIVREGLKRVISGCQDMRLVGEAADAGAAIAECKAAFVDVLLLDISMPGPGFLETISRLRKARPALRVLILSMHPEDQYAVRSLRAGAAGYLTKDHSPKQLAAAIRHVYGGGKYVSPSLGEKLALHLAHEEAEPPHEALSDREYEVMGMLGSGETVTEIAERLSLSPKTVSTYRSRMLGKLNLRNDADLARYMIENKLVD